jgi:hypothetical protein
MASAFGTLAEALDLYREFSGNSLAISESTDGEILAEVASEIHESDGQRLCELAERGVTFYAYD